MDFEDSQTYLNLQIALQDLLENNSLLELFESNAQEEVLIPISFLFNTTARNSRYIAAHIYETLYGDLNTLDNLQIAREREDEELRTYREYSQVAIDEGFEDYASLFNGIANVMLNHLLAYDNAIDNIINGTLYCKSEESLWICLGCGNILSGICAPDICPVCGVPGGYYDQLTTYR